MDCSTPGFSVHHQCPELTQIHVHWVKDAIQPSHPLSSPFPAFNLSQHQDLFQWVSSSHQVAKVLGFQLQCQSFQWIFRTETRIDWFDLPAVQGTLKSFPTPQFKSINYSALSCLYIVQLSYPYMTTRKIIKVTKEYKYFDLVFIKIKRPKTLGCL